MPNYVVKSGEVNIAAGEGGEIFIPSQPNSGGWTVSVVDYGGEPGFPQAHVQIAITARPAGTKQFHVWLWEGTPAPSDLSKFKLTANNAIAPSGTTIVDMWLPAGSLTATVWQAIVTASADGTVAPSGSPVIKSFTIAANIGPNQPTDLDVSVVVDSTGTGGAFRVDCTPPLADIQYWLVNWYRIRYTDDTYTTIWPDGEHGTLQKFGSVERSGPSTDLHPWTQPSNWQLPPVTEYWRFYAKSVSKNYTQNETSPPHFDVTVPAGPGYGSTAFAPPVESPTLSYRYTDYGDGRGKRLELLGGFADPSTLGTYAGCVLYFEANEQSNAPLFELNDSTLDGTANLGGNWHPEWGISGKLGDDKPFVIPDLDPVSKPTVMRVYFNSVNSAQVENALVRANESGATPSATVTVMPPGLGATGEEFCKNPTNVQVSVAGGFEGAIFYTRVTTTYDGPVGGDGVYVEIPYTDANGVTTTDTAVGVGGKAENRFATPKSIQNVKLRARGFVDNHPGVEDDLVNTYVPGITPEVSITLGVTTGTVDVGEAVAATLAPSLSAINKILGIPPAGVTEQLLQAFAVSQEKLKAAQIIDAQRIVDQAVQNAKLADLAINAPKIADFSVERAKIALLAVDGTRIETAAITNAKVAFAAIGAANIATLSVGATHIQAAAITTGHIQNAAITSALIGFAAVQTAHIADLSVTEAKIATLSVGKLSAGSMVMGSTTFSVGTFGVSVTTTGTPLGTAVSQLGGTGLTAPLGAFTAGMTVGGVTTPNFLSPYFENASINIGGSYYRNNERGYDGDIVVFAGMRLKVRGGIVTGWF